MLKIRKKRRAQPLRIAIVSFALLAMITGSYILTLTAAPEIASVVASRPIAVSSLDTPRDNRIVIPRIGVDIPYDKGAAALDRGAEWRYPSRGNPVDGGNFIIAAHRFSIQPTIGGTLEKSPFYAIDRLAKGDRIIIDYSGKRYAYEITDKINVSPNQTEIEAPSDEPKLTLYSCTLNGSADGRIVIVSKRLGEVATTASQQ